MELYFMVPYLICGFSGFVSSLIMVCEPQYLKRWHLWFLWSVIVVWGLFFGHVSHVVLKALFMKEG